MVVSLRVAHMLTNLSNDNDNHPQDMAGGQKLGIPLKTAVPTFKNPIYFPWIALKTKHNKW